MIVGFFDIDGTLLDNSHRRPLVTGCEKKDWDAFYSDELTMLDSPIRAAQEALPRVMSQLDGYYFLTGRPEHCRRVTLWQLESFFKMNVPPTQLLMRPDRDWRKGFIYKEEQIQRNLSCMARAFFFDDDTRNRAVYTRYGLFFKAPECWEVIL